MIICLQKINNGSDDTVGLGKGVAIAVADYASWKRRGPRAVWLNNDFSAQSLESKKEPYPFDLLLTRANQVLIPKEPLFTPAQRHQSDTESHTEDSTCYEV